MMRVCFPLISVVLLAMCTDDNSYDFPLLPPGTYEGTYYRWSPLDPSPEVANVHFGFFDGSFSGASSISRYPAICNGKYNVSGSHVEFTNLCYWTAEFDWSFILNGKFKISPDGEYFKLTRKEGDWIDVYRIKRNSIN